MILGRGDRGDDQFLLVGLSRENMERLQKGQPIMIKRDTHGEAIPELWTICIMFGETEIEMASALHQAGALKGAKIIQQKGL